MRLDLAHGIAPWPTKPRHSQKRLRVTGAGVNQNYKVAMATRTLLSKCWASASDMLKVHAVGCGLSRLLDFRNLWL